MRSTSSGADGIRYRYFETSFWMPLSSDVRRAGVYGGILIGSSQANKKADAPKSVRCQLARLCGRLLELDRR
jgi:hypothetical protein